MENMNNIYEFKQIDAYILWEFHKKISPTLHRETLIQSFEKELGLEEDHFHLNADEFHKCFRMNQPKTKYLVHRLKEMGFAPGTISQWLDINATSVSYHLKRPLESEYRNPFLLKYFQSIRNILHNTAKIQEQLD